ncbi:MAG: hypothetical protein KKD05_10540 [Candidatus Omnitrophica bacterium]|nr:hypothetical protein [Candidatus Omnitrophota bacterium]
MRRGFGLGLTFCKLAVEKLGGRIAASNHQEKGAMFTFTLGLKPKNFACQKAQSGLESPNKSKDVFS